MAKFIIMYMTTSEAKQAMMSITKEEQEATMVTWNAWKDALGDHILEFGSMFMMGKKMITKDAQEDPSSTVMGYTFIQADDLQEALELTSKHPFLDYHQGCHIEVQQCMTMPEI